MTAVAETLDLSPFDTFHAIEPDPRTYPRNLAALSGVAPEWAQHLSRARLPENWRPARALDGFVTHRCEPPGSVPAWAAGSALPLERADALLRDYDWGELNATLPGIGSGAELVRLLQRMPPTGAVFVFESDSTRLAAVLSVLDLSAALRELRCVLVPPDQPAAFLERLLRRFPGLLPPGNILRLPECGEPHLAAVHELCTRIATQFAQERRVRIDALRAAAAAPAAACRERERLAVIALTPDPADAAFAQYCATTAAELGWDCELLTHAGPTYRHPLALAERCAAFRPTRLLLVNPRFPLPPLPWPPAVGLWHLTAPPSLPADEIPGVEHFAATPRIAKRLRAAGAPAEHVEALYWPALGGAAESEIAPIPQAGSEPAVLLCGDYPDPRAGANRIEQPTHRLLWQQLRQGIEQTWSRGAELDPERLLAGAERSTGLRIEHGATRKHLRDRAADSLIPAVVGERIVRTLRDHGFRAFALGKGWDLCTSRPADTIPGSIYTPHGRACVRTIAPLAAISVGSGDPFTAELPTLALMGVPTLVHGPDADLPPAREAWRTFRNAAELERSLANFAAARESGRVAHAAGAARHAPNRQFAESLRKWAARTR
jgi:hypothetical protein